MTVIAQQGDMLQVYNSPMGKASSNDLPNAYSVCLPR
jgi:hypothetical protein